MPFASTAHSDGMGVPLEARLTISPRLEAAVAKSTTMGSLPSGLGQAKQNGFVPKIRFVPPFSGANFTDLHWSFTE